MSGSSLLYIISIGHSGSTLLDLLCGSIPNVFSTGELRYYSWQILHGRIKPGSIENQNICSCLKTFENCPVWSRVTSILTDRTGIDLADDPLSFRIGYMRPQAFTRDMPRLPVLLRRMVGWSARTPGAGALAAASRRFSGPVTRNNRMLIDAVGEVTGSRWVVDSTKDPLRFDHLYRSMPDQARLIILTRNPFGIAWSSQKRGRDPEPVLREWRNFYGKLDGMLRGIPLDRILPVTYEDVCSEPSAIRRRIAAFLDLEDPGDMPLLDTRNHHMVAGNPMRYRGVVSIREDHSWQDGLENATRGLVSAIIGSSGLPSSLSAYTGIGKAGR